MGSFRPHRWKPWNDSSPGAFQLDPECVVLLRYGDGCPCGCGGYPESAGTTFRMGHDARLRGILIRAHLMDVKVRYYLDGTTLTEPVDAMKVASTYAWEESLNNAVLRRDGKNRELLRAASKHPQFLKAGRWAYTGGQVIAMYKPDERTGKMDVMYVDRAGKVRKARIPAAAAEEIV
jgi:hypothetical protein